VGAPSISDAAECFGTRHYAITPSCSGIYSIHLLADYQAVLALTSIEPAGSTWLIAPNNHSMDHMLRLDRKLEAGNTAFVNVSGFKEAEGNFTLWVEPPENCAPAPRAETLASRVGWIIDMAVDDESVYWLNSEYISKVSRNGGAPTLLASELKDSKAIALYGRDIYVATSHQVLKVPVDGGVPRTLTSSSSAIHDIAVNSEGVFFATDDSIMKVPRGGNAPIELATPPIGDKQLAVDDAYAYWGSPEGVMKVPLAGGLPITFSKHPYGAAALTATNKAIYWSGYYRTSLLSSPLDGSTSDILSPGGNEKALGLGPKIVADDTHVYWAVSYQVQRFLGGSSSEFRILMAPITKGPFTTVAYGQMATAMAIDATNLYWGTNTGELMKLAIAAATVR